MYNTVLLAIITIKLVERKVCFISEASNGGQGGVLRFPSKSQPPSPALTQTTSGEEPKGQKLQSFYRWREGATYRNSTVILKLVISDLINTILMVLSTVSFQFQGQFFLIYLRPVLRTVAGYVLATVWSSYSHHLPLSGGFSIYKTTQKTQLRIRSTAPEEELEALDYPYRLNQYYSVSLDSLFSFVSAFSHFSD